MKIAAVSNNGKSISAHFGKARYFVVVTVEGSDIISREIIDREAIAEAGYQNSITTESARQLNVLNTVSGEHQHADQAGGKHHNIEPIRGCDIVLSRGMGTGMYSRLQEAGLKTILTDVMDIDEAVKAYVQGKLVNIPELIH